MPSHNFKMAENGAQEMEVFDTSEHKSGYAYMPVMPCQFIAGAFAFEKKGFDWMDKFWRKKYIDKLLDNPHCLC